MRRVLWRKLICLMLILAVSPALHAAPVVATSDTALAPANVREPGLRPKKRPDNLGNDRRRCTSDRKYCITLDDYIPDVCRTIEATAKEAKLDVNFFARLLWKESLFDAGAVSPVGAQGIAQFMPGTAALRGLKDPFNPAEAMRASAIYLSELRDLFGNLGLAAAAYNAGEARVDDFVRRGRRLPPETRAYVPAITGFSGTDWRVKPPKKIDLRLDKYAGFQDACVDLASKRSLKEFRSPSSSMPWAVIVAAHQQRDIAQFKYTELSRKRSILRDYNVSSVRMQLPAKHGTQHTVQIGTSSRRKANTICSRLRRASVPCIVLRN